MTDRAADDRLGDTTTNHQWRAAAAALAATETAAAMAEARVMAAVKVMRTSNDDDNDDATTRRRDNADDANDDADGEGGKELTTRLPGGRGGLHYPHRRMGGEAHGFVRLPPRLAAKTTTMAASAGGSAGSPPWLRARQQACAATRDDDDKDEDDRVQRATKALAAGDTRATRCAGGRRPATQSSMIAGLRATTKRAAYKSKQQPTIVH